MYYAGNQRQNPYQGWRHRHQRFSLANSRSIAIAGILGFLSLWHLTPLSDWIIDQVLVFVPIEIDIQLGREAWRSMNYSPAVDQWSVNRIGRELVSQLRLPRPLPWSFGVIQADFVNAFALPGGIVRVTDSLLQRLRLSDAELAALLAHEMGHILHRHSQARILQDKLMSFLSKKIFQDSGSHQDSFSDSVGKLLLKSASFLGTQSFSRKNEYEADAAAWDMLLHSRIYSPKAVEKLLQKLWDASGGSGKTSWESTHPGTQDRIVALQVKWNSLPIQERKRLNRLRI
jgi:predicted Zn-dependent protease